jgi:hypothetical protein
MLPMQPRYPKDSRITDTIHFSCFVTYGAKIVPEDETRHYEGQCEYC